MFGSSFMLKSKALLLNGSLSPNEAIIIEADSGLVEASNCSGMSF